MRGRSLALSAVFLVLSVLAFAQADPNTRIISGRLNLPPGTPATNSMMRIQLVYCGGNSGRVPSNTPGNPATVVSFLPFEVRTASDGTWTSTIYGNDVIICGTDASGGSRWRIRPIYNGVGGPAVDYQIESCSGMQQITVGTPTCSDIPPFVPDTAPQCGTVDGSGRIIRINCAVQYSYTTPPPPPIVGPPGPPGPQGPPGSAGGAVNAGTATHIAYYAADGSVISPDPIFTDDGTTLSYQNDFFVSGNATIDSEVLIQGAYYVDSPPPLSPMAAAPAGRSAIAVSNDGAFYISANAGTPAKICTVGDAACISSPAAIHVNGQTIAPGGSGDVNAGAAAHTVALNEGASTALQGIGMAAHQVLIGVNSADPVLRTVPDCQDTSGNHLNYRQSTDAWSCGTSAGASNIRAFQVTACKPANSTDSQCTGTITISPAYADANYIPILTANNNGTAQNAVLVVTVNGTKTASTIPYVISCTFFCSPVNTPTIYVFTYHP